MDEIDKLLSRYINEPRETLTYAEDKDSAEALVVVQYLVSCSNCNLTYHTPNKKLMIRSAKHISLPKQWIESYNQLPREIKNLKTSCEFCPSCIAGADLHDFILEQNK